MGWFTQSHDGNNEVQVRAGESSDRNDQATTEFLFIDHSSSSGSHDHVVITDTGDVIHDTTGSL